MAEHDDAKSPEDDAAWPDQPSDGIRFVEQEGGSPAAGDPPELLRLGDDLQLNPYASPDADTPVKEAPRAPSPPQPNIFVAVLLMVLLLLMQFVSVAVGVVVFTVFTAVTGGNVTAAGPDEMTLMLIPVAAFSMVFTGVVMGLLMYRQQFFRKLSIRGCTPFQWLLVAMLLVPQSILASEVGNWALEVVHLINLPWLYQMNDMSWMEAFSQQPWLLVFFSVCIFPGIGEEIYFRGIISRGLVGRHGVWVGAILTSILFGLMHIVPIQVAGTILIGLMLQLVFMTTRSLTSAIVLHTANNAMAFAMTRHSEWLPIPGYTAEVPGQLSHVPVPLLLAALATTALVLALLFQTRTRWMTADGEWRPGFFPTEMPPAALAARPVSEPPNLLLVGGMLLSTLALVAAIAFSIAA